MSPTDRFLEFLLLDPRAQLATARARARVRDADPADRLALGPAVLAVWVTALGCHEPGELAVLDWPYLWYAIC